MNTFYKFVKWSFGRTGVRTILASGSAGFLGGIIASLREPHDNPFYWFSHLHHAGFFGDAAIGLAAGITVLLITLSSDHPNSPPPLIRIIPMGLLAGYAGSSFLSKMTNAELMRDIVKVKNDQTQLSMNVETNLDVFKAEQEKLRDQIKKQIEKRNKITGQINEGERKVTESDSIGKTDRANEPGIIEERKSLLVGAKALFNQTLQLDGDNPLIYVELGKVDKRYAQLSPENFAEAMSSAMDDVNKAINLDTNYDRAFYNRACYRALLKQDVPLIIDDLKRAIDLLPQNRVDAITDPDFRSVTNTPEFKSLIGP